MNQLIFALKREYWECKKQLVVVPLIVTGLFFLMAMVATWSHHFSDSDVSISEKSAQVERTIADLGGEGLSAPGDVETIPSNSDDARGDPKEYFWFSGVYLASAWLAAMFYALSSLFNDRRDKSILYWKTMPVSELQTVIAKLVFAILGFSIVAIGISWVSAIVLIGYAHIVFSPEVFANEMVSMNYSKLVIWPLITVLVSLVWCAPVFALLLYVSARVKKMPLLIFVMSVIVVRVIESVVFSSDHIFDFLVEHSPFGLTSKFSEMATAGEFLQIYLVDFFPSLVLGLLISCLLIWRTAWHRDNNFEI